MSAPAAAVHADWLALVEPHGQFLTLPVLRNVMPDGLPRTPDHIRLETRERAQNLADDDGARTAWLEFLLRDALAWGPHLKAGLEVPDQLTHTVAELHVTLRPDYALLDPTTGTARVLIERYPHGTRLDQRIPGDAWAASPIERTALLCRATGVPLGICTDARHLVLVWAPLKETGGHATWDTALFAEGAEARLLDALVDVLGARRLFAAAVGDRLEDLLRDSGNAQEELTRTLGHQVRQAVELLVAAISRADLDSGHTLLPGIPPHTVYEASCTVLMRLVFLLYAEERGLLRLGEPVYDANYAVSTLREQLIEVSDIAGDEPLELRTAAWHRLLATFRAVHGGISHDRLNLPAYGGTLFDPDRYTFLEGRTPNQPWHTTPAHPLPVDDLTVREILTALQTITTRAGKVTENRRLSFRTLDVEQIGFVYEGLLDHSALRANGPILGMTGKAALEPEIPLHTVESHAAQGGDHLVSWLAEQTGRTVKQVTDLLAHPLDADARRRLLAACENDATLLDRVTPYAALLRDDLRGLPLVVPDGGIYVTEVSHRRDTGTEYTPRTLADEIVKYALEPLVYNPGPAQGAEPADWVLKPSEELLALTVCDPAVGSGAILVAACRYLADRLLEAWTREDKVPDGYAPTPGGSPDEDELVIQARRAIADRCLFAVDRDPMAVEMAKLSLWLTTLAKDRPFTFLDHALQAGDSLLGVTTLDQVIYFHPDPAKGRRLHADIFGDLSAAIRPVVDEAIAKRRQLESLPVRDTTDSERKATLNREVNAALQEARTVADIITGAALSSGGDDTRMDAVLVAIVPDVRAALAADGAERSERFSELRVRAEEWLNSSRPEATPTRRCLHWPLAFPEVLTAGRFDAVIGNPPFLGGKRISGRNGVDYREYLVSRLADGRKGSADLVGYFFLRAIRLSAGLGLLATNSIGQGDTREVALDSMLGSGEAVIVRAESERVWPGAASVTVSILWLRAEWHGAKVLDGRIVDTIGSDLTVGRRVKGPPIRLVAEGVKGFYGTVISGSGFILSRNESASLLAANPLHRRFIRPYLTGKDLMTEPDSRATRDVIDLGGLSLQEARDLVPDLVRIVETRVKPDRDKVKRRVYREQWWLFAEPCTALYASIQDLPLVICMPQTAKYLVPRFVIPSQVLSQTVVTIPSDSYAVLGALASNLHLIWSTSTSSTIQGNPRYMPSDSLETFPFPASLSSLLDTAREWSEERESIAVCRRIGLTQIYNLVHNSAVVSDDIQRFREAQRSLDITMAQLYGWSDLPINHGFNQTRHGIRWTIAPATQLEVLNRLLELNHARHAEEVARGLHTKATRRAPGVRRAAAAPSRAAGMLDFEL